MSLLKLLDRPITFHRVFVDLTGSINAALMLSNAVYWTNKLPPEREGWFHKSREEWTTETGLTIREQETAQQRLIELALLETRRAKLPNTECVTGTWFRVVEDAITAALSAPTNLRKTQIAKTRKTQHQNAENADWSPYRSKNIDYTQESPPPPRAIPFSLSDGWQPNAATGELLIADGIPAEFIAHCLPEFCLFWQTRNEPRTDAAWQTAFIRQVRAEFAFQAQQEARRHDRNDQRQSVSGRPQSQSRSPRKESITERNERYERFAAGLDASIDATERARNARKTAGDAIPGEFRRH
jgi:hypothetical protein